MTREEAIKIVRNIYQTDAEKEALGTLVPELAESENKKISNLIYCIVRDREDVKNTLEANGVSVNDALAYLEKQKDSKVVKFDHDREQKPAKKQDYSGFNKLERIIHRGFLRAGVENAPVVLIKETAQECLAQMQPTGWSEEEKDKVVQYLHDRDGGMLWSKATEIAIDILCMLRPSWKPSEEQM